MLRPEDRTRGTRRARPSRQTLLVLGTAAALLVVTAVAGHPCAGLPRYLPDLQLPWWALAVAFAATEAVVVIIQVEREAQTVSLSELPLVLGLFFASPVQLLVGRLLGSAAIFVLHRRSSPLKTTLNLALLSAETSVALALFRALAPSGHGLTPVAWLGAYAGALVANALGAVAISLVIAVYEGGLRLRGLLVEAAVGQPAAPLVVTVALVAVISLSYDTRSAWLLAACAVALLLAYRSHASLSDRHLNLERLYGFSRAVSSAPEADEVLRRVLAEAKELLRSEHAEVAFVATGGDDLARVRLSAGDRLSRAADPRSAEDHWLLAQLLDDAAPVLLPRGGRDPQARRWLEAQALREAVAVPLRGGAGVMGLLLVGDRMGEVRTYDDSDVLLLETVADHASIALQNGELADKLRHESLHDALTGLPNRLALQRRLATALDDVHDTRSPGAAVMILDLDGFKDVNDTLGHEHGDRLLREVGTQLVRAVGEAGFVARLGGDEFAVLVPGATDEHAMLRLGRRVLGALDQPVVLDGLEVAVSGSLGVALAPVHATDPTALLKRADLAMYDAKASSRGLRLYEPDLDTHDPRRLTLVSELRAALQHGDVHVHVQPQARLATGEVVAVEALARWEHERLGTITPDEFIPLAERSGLIGAITTRVLDGALAACAAWRDAGHELGVAVNLSTRSFADPDLVDEVARLLRRHAVPGPLLTLEVTEGSVMTDPATAIALLHQLRDLGVRLSIDDFGTGYSSLSYLKRLPVQEVKIDRSFVSDLRDGGEDAAIVRTIVDLGRHLGLQVVAEGVEDQATWDLLTSFGCDTVQGWHLGRAMPTGELLPWLATRSGAHRGLRVV